MKDKYYTLNRYFKDKYGQRVHKITINAGFSCPNIDGTINRGGCIYCNNLAFNPQLRERRVESIKQQIIKGIQFAEARYKAKKYMVYYQPYTNTYADVRELKKKYNVIKSFSGIIGLAIGTRPDCVDEDKLGLISSYSNSYEVWIEYGLQSARDRTLKLINRGHDFNCFKKAVEETKKKGIRICAHVIIGLPGEGLKDYIYTAERLAELNIEGVKLHPAHVVIDTKLAQAYEFGNYIPPDFEQYIEAAATMIEFLPPNCIVQRVGASVPDEMLIAPEWINDERNVGLAVNNNLEESNSWQGNKYHEISNSKYQIPNTKFRCSKQSI